MEKTLREREFKTVQEELQKTKAKITALSFLKRIISLVFSLISNLSFGGVHFEKAQLSVDDKTRSYKSGFALISDHQIGGPEYKWVIINFYTFSLSDHHISEARKNNLNPI